MTLYEDLKSNIQEKFSSRTFTGLQSQGMFAKRPVIGMVMFLLGSLVFGWLAYNLQTKGFLYRWDMSMTGTFHIAQKTVPWPFMENLLFGFFLGKEVVILTGITLVIYFVYKRFWRELALVLITLSGGGLLWYFLSRYFDRPRPAYQHEVLALSDPSFPSGLALMAILGYGLLAYLLIPNIRSIFWKWLIGIVLTLTILFVGLFTLMFGTNYVTDVFAGYFLGIAWAGVAFTSIEKLFKASDPYAQEKSQNSASQYDLRSPGLFKKRPLIGLAMVIVGCLVFAVLGYNLLAKGPLVQLDESIYKTLLAQAKAAPYSLNEIMLFGFFVGKQAVQVIVALLSIYFIYKRLWPELAMINLGSMGGGFLWNYLIYFFNRTRPPDQTGLAIKSIPTFPSGHATGVVICYGFLAYVLIPMMPSKFWKWTVGIVILFIILFDGFSRVFQSNHYLTDVLAGYALGLAWLGLVCTVIELLFLRKRN